MVAAAIPLAGAGFALSAMAKAVQSLYGMAVDINDYLDKHIEDMKGSENPTISRSGRVLEMAKLGFGIGYLTPVVIISVGQLLLGNTLSAVGTIATAATLSNPIAMTCAAIGAIYYGWGALSDVEREEILDKLSKGLEIGIELIKSMVTFVTEKTKTLLNSENIAEMKQFVRDATENFGKTLYDVTGALGDKLSNVVNSVRTMTTTAIDNAVVVASDAYVTVKETASKAADGTRDAIGSIKAKSQKIGKIEPPQP